MTVPNTTARNDYTGTGAVSVYAYTFRLFQNADLKVVQRDLSGVETTLALTTDYTVTGAGGYSGGTVTLVAGNLPTGYKLSIIRDPAQTQTTDFRNQGTFYAETIEAALDRLTMQVLRLQDQLNRAAKLKETDYGAATTELPTPAASKVLAWNLAATALEGVDLGSIVLAVPADGSVSNAKLVDMATQTLKGRNTAGTGDPEDLTPSTVRTMLGYCDRMSSVYQAMSVNSLVIGRFCKITGTVALTLPNIDINGRVITIKVAETAPANSIVTVTPDASDTIVGHTSLKLTPGDCVTLVSENSATWHIAEADVRPAAFAGYDTATQTGVVANTTNLTWASTETVDTHAAGTTTNFTAPRAGLYRIDLHGVPSGGAAAFYVYKNGTATEVCTASAASTADAVGGGILSLAAGDVLTVRENAANNVTKMRVAIAELR